MTRPRSGIGSELLVVILVPVCLAGSLALIMATHRRAASKATTARKVVAPVPIAPPVVLVEPPKPPAPPPVRVDPPVNPTKEILARLALAEHEQKAEARRADRKAEALELARREAVERSQSWKRRVMAVRGQIDALSDRAEALEKVAGALALQRDALARERDAAKAALAKARTRSSYAILPHKGPNGTWRRPVVIECHGGMATLRPRGPSVSLLELSPLFGTRTNPLISAVARELARSQAKPSPDGTPAVPYIYFVVRPDGIRPYYEARSRLEPLGVAFGYELVEQDWEIEFPDSDDPGEPSDGPGAPSGSGSRVGDVVWPLDEPRRGDSASKDSFLWPTEPRQGGGRPGSLAGEERGLISSDELRRRVAALERAANDSLAPRSIDDLLPELNRNAPEPRPLGVPPTAKPIEIPGPGAADEWVRGDRPPEVPRGDSKDPGRAGGATGPRSGVEGSPRVGSRSQGLGSVSAEPGSLAGALPELPPLERTAGDGVSRSQEGGQGSAGRVPDRSGSPSPALRAHSPTGRGEEGNEMRLLGSGSGGSASGGSEIGDVPFEIDVACGPDGLVIHPGGYHLSLKAMREQNGVFVQYLETTVHLRRQVEPTARLRPRVRFLVEVGGSTTYWEARRQTVLSGLDWPVTLRAADPGIVDVFPKESW